MKVGTLSLNINAPDFNYGAMLHTWATQQYLLKKEGIETEVIDYTMPKIEGWDRYDAMSQKTEDYAGENEEELKEKYLRRVQKFDSFIENHLIVSKEKYIQQTIAFADLPYDTVLCESDVIWNAKRGRLDPVFYLSTPSMRGKRRIAYAPSMADAQLTRKHQSQLDMLLENVHFISCRESYQKPLLEAHTNKVVQHVVDPVMLLDPEDYECITAPRIMQEDYLLLYLPVDNNKLLRKSAVQYAEDHHLKILEISTKLREDSDELQKCLPDAGIEEFLSAIKYADMVFTNSFHAICFAIIFQTPFFAFTRKYNGKVWDVCERFGLEEYYVRENDLLDKEPADMKAVHKRFKELQAEGRQWLDHALTAELEPESANYSEKKIIKMLDNGKRTFLEKSATLLRRYNKRLRKKLKKFSIRKMPKKVMKRLRKFKKKFTGKVMKYPRRFTKKFMKSLRRYKSKLSSKIQYMRIELFTALTRQKMEIDNNKIVVSSISNSFSCNPKYICKEMIRRKLPYEIIWLVEDGTDIAAFPPEIRTINKKTIDAAREVYSAKLWLDNGVCFSELFEIKPGQYHVQTMHGSLGIKRLDNSTASRSKTKHGRDVIRRENQNTNFVLINSQFEEDVFNSALWSGVPMPRYGHARTDILFQDNAQTIDPIRSALLERYGIPKDKKLVLFAPTHRKWLKAADLEIDYKELTETFSSKFGGDYVVMLRLHYKTRFLLQKAGSSLIEEQQGIVFDVTDYPDIQELMLVTDVGITDYSSWIYDYVNTRKPGFIYAADLDQYNDVTGLYYPLEETPFPVCSSCEEMLQKIREFDNDVYLQKVEAFLSEKQSVDDGHSAERAVGLIEELMNK